MKQTLVSFVRTMTLLLAMTGTIGAQTLLHTDLAVTERESALVQKRSSYLSFYSIERLYRYKLDLPYRHYADSPALRAVQLPSITYASWNSNLPFGDRDGLLWQGRGINASATTGVYLDGPWWSLTIAPEVAVAENRVFDLGPSGFADNPYGHVTAAMDYPQQMGSDAWSLAHLGQSEARLYWRNLTIGAGTQNVVFGPARINPILLSNEAPGFPHIDLGLLPAETAIGTFEARALWGVLTESVAFDDNPDNDRTVSSMLAVSYRPIWFDALTFSLYRTVAVNQEDVGSRFVWQVFDPRPRGGSNGDDPTFGSDAVDQRVALSLELLFPVVGSRTYVEWARNDFASNWFSFVQIPYHSAAWTAGWEQIAWNGRRADLLTVLELTHLWQSRNYFLGGAFSRSFFYGHPIVNHGHTNQGQLLGAPAGPGSEGGTLRLVLRHDAFRLEGYIERYAVNADYVYAQIPNTGREVLDTESTWGLALSVPRGPITLRFEGAHVTRHAYNYQAGAQKLNVWLASSVTYRF